MTALVASLLTLSAVFSLNFLLGLLVHYRSRKLEKGRNKISMFSFEEMYKKIDAITLSQTTITQAMGEVITTLKGIQPQPGNARVYAVIVQRGKETKIVMNLAQSFEQAIHLVQNEYSTAEGWMATASGFIDVKPNIIQQVEKLMVDKSEGETKEQNYQNYIYNLKYARDNFANDSQKKAIDGLIKSIEKTYGRSVRPNTK